MNISKTVSTRTSFLAMAAAVLWFSPAIAAPLPPQYPVNSAALFAAAMQDPAPIEEMENNEVLAPNLQRQVVNYTAPIAAGTVVIDTEHTYLYYVLGGNRAIRYGIGVGRDGFTWSGSQVVTRMAEWPDWVPPQEMIVRQPYLARWMAGGEGNPLGARAIYLGDTVYRIHGTNAPATIGTRVSSGCIRLTNADVADLYNRVTVGTKIIVLGNRGQLDGKIAKTNHSAPPIRVATPGTAGLRVNGIY